ncbi:MAG: ABC transporter substrate-binding protein [Pseudolabrys sp.]
MGRRPHHHDRVPLGRRQKRTPGRYCCRVRAPKGHRYCHRRNCGSCCGKAGDIGHTDCLRHCRGSCSPRPSYFALTAGRKHHRHVKSVGRSSRQARLELLRGVAPSLRRVAVLANVGARIGVLEMGEVRDAGRKLGLEVVPLEVQRTEDIAPALASVKGNVDALYVVTDPLLNTSRVAINTLAIADRLPTMHGEKAYVEAGGLMSYGSNYPDLFRRAAEQVDKILRGAKPGDIPVEQPTKFDLAINLTTAKALGVTVPPLLLAQADDVIE